MYPLYLTCVALPLLYQSCYTWSAHTSNGLIIGHAASKSPDVIEYLGIPYAQPPIHDLRFAAPKKIEDDGESTFEASVFSFTPKPTDVLIDFSSSSCPVAPASPSKPYPEATEQFSKVIAAFTGSIDKNRSEDCLTLNIWSKDTSTEDKPVIVFFYGGRFSTGTANTPFYNGQYLASSQDVIVVTLNFRINIFGFPGAPLNSQNIGFLDQRLAVEWVRDNIRAFGGDPDRIVISGQSSGAVAVDYWSFAYVDEPIVSGCIENSGNAFSFGVNSNEVATKNWYQVSEQLGCGSEGDTLPCMRAVKDFRDIEEATTKVKPPPGSNPARPPPAFQPTADGVTVFENYTILSNNGNVSRLPFLVGQVDNEAGYYKISAYSANVTLPDSTWAEFNDASFTCPIAYAAANRLRYSSATTNPTYRFRYFGDWPNLRLYPTSGAYHGSDIEMIIGGSEDVSGLLKSEEEKMMEGVFMRAWAAFARDPVSGLEGEGWPVYEGAGTETLVRLGYGGRGGLEVVRPDIYDGICDRVEIGG